MMNMVLTILSALSGDPQLAYVGVDKDAQLVVLGVAPAGAQVRVDGIYTTIAGPDGVFYLAVANYPKCKITVHVAGQAANIAPTGFCS